MLPLILTVVETPEETTAFEKLYHNYSRLMFVVAKDYLGDDFLAEDAVIEAFFRIAKNFKKTNDVDSDKLKNYCVVITKNIAIDILRKRKKINYYEDLEIPSVEHRSINAVNLDALESKVSYNQLLHAINNLPDIYKDTIYLHSVMGYSVKEIASLLNANTTTISKRLYRGKELLKEYCESNENN